MIGKIQTINFEDKNNNTNKKPQDDVSNDDLIETIYILNPLSIIACGFLQLRIIYNFLFFVTIINFDYEWSCNKNTGFLKTFLRIFFILINLLFCPANAFTIIFYFLRNFINSGFIYKLKTITTLIINLALLTASLYLLYDTNEFYGIMNHYSNYFFVKSKLPNLGLMWTLFPEVNIIF